MKHNNTVDCTSEAEHSNFKKVEEGGPLCKQHPKGEAKCCMEQNDTIVYTSEAEHSTLK